MEENEVTGWQKRLRLRRISLVAIIICIILLLSIALLTVYGSHVGNFVVQISGEKQNVLSLFNTAETEIPSNAKEMLLAQGVDNMVDTSYATISKSIAESTVTPGLHNDERRRYFAFTFLLKNTSSIALDYSASLQITGVTKNVDNAVRVLVAKDDEQNIYAKQNANGEAETCGQNKEYSTIPFQSSFEIFANTVTNFASEKETKYTVAIWLEGWDEDCVDAIKGGTIKMEMLFTVL